MYNISIFENKTNIQNEKYNMFVVSIIHLTIYL